MKIRKSLLLSASLLMIAPFVLSSCNKENLQPDINKVKTQTEDESGSLRSITFNIALPGGEPVTYAPQVHDAQEYAIAGMTLYMFDASGNNVYSTPLLNSELSGAGPTYTVSKRISVPSNGQYQFRVVANEDLSSSMNANINGLNALNASNQQVAGASCSRLLNANTIPMTGQTPLMDISSGNAINIALTRIVARIDVLNNVPGFSIDELRLSNAAPSSALFPGRFVSGSLVSNVSSFQMVSSPVVGTSSTQYKKAFYLYEKQNSADNNVTKVLVLGHDSQNRKFLYTVPFKSNGSYTNVERNRLYRIQIGDGVTPPNPDDANQISFQISVSDWTPVDVERGFKVVEVDYVPGTGSGTYDANTRTFTTNSPQLSGAEFSIRDIFANQADYNVSVSTEAQAWLQASVSGTTLTVSTANANTSGAKREGVISISSQNDPSTKCQIKVVQLAN